MSNELAVEPQAVECVAGPQAEPETPGARADAAQDWREHVRELRAENARRRKENQELRAQVAALEGRSRAAEAAAQREAARLATAHRRLKEAALARLTRQALDEACGTAAVGGAGEAGAVKSTAEGGCATHVSPAKIQRLVELVPAPVALDADLTVTEEGEVEVSAEAAERLKGYAAELAALASVAEAAGGPTGRMPVSPAAPPVGGEPPRAARPAIGPAPNAWDPALQRTPAARARAVLHQAAALDGLAAI